MSYKTTYRSDDAVCYFHCIAHTVYRTEEGDHYALNDADKDMILELMKRLELLYAGGVEVMQYTIMSNHLHIILAEYKEFDIESVEVKRRYEEFHQNKKGMDARSVFCHQFARRLNNISCFMADLQWYSANFFNNARKINGRRKRGSLWNPRFRRCTLKGEAALFKCSLYVAMNPLRAGLVKRAEDYKWGSWGERRLHGHHPHTEAWRKFYCGSEVGEDCFDAMERDFAEALGELEKAIEQHGATKTHRYSSQQPLILNNNSFWNRGGLIRPLSKNFLAHDSPEKLGVT